MAGLVWDDGDKARITLYVGDKRRTIRLGKVSKAVGTKWQDRIGEIVASISSGAGIAPDVAAWIDGLADVGYGRLVKAGLVMPRVVEEKPVRTVRELCDKFKARQDVKPNTMKGYAQTCDSLLAHFGPDRDVATITAGDGEDWRSAIVKATKGEGKRKKARLAGDNRLAPASVSKRTSVAKRIFAKAVAWGWIASNPLAQLKVGPQSNPSRNVYVPVETIDDVIEAAPGQQWRTLIGLARFAGLRCPSEIGLLRWCDVDTAAGRLHVRSPKTEGHEGHASRLVPISPRLRSILADAFDAAADGEALVCPLAARQTANLRTGLERILVRAGHTPWPRLFQQLRSSVETDWASRHPLHAVARWLGHSPRIAMNHYLVTRDRDFQAVIDGEGEAPQERGTKRGTTVAPNTPPQASEGSRNVSQPESDSAENPEQLAFSSCGSEDVNACIMAEAGIEPARG